MYKYNIPRVKQHSTASIYCTVNEYGLGKCHMRAAQEQCNIATMCSAPRTGFMESMQLPSFLHYFREKEKKIRISM